MVKRKISRKSQQSNVQQTEMHQVAILQFISALVAIEFGVRAPLILSSSRGTTSLCLARHVTAYLAHIVYQIPIIGIARILKRDRTSVTYALHVIEDNRDDPFFEQKLSNIERLLVMVPLTLQKLTTT
ncbi:MAG: helix-turn-helix domain-containing protein [Robiginitomaculum sp.]